MGILSLSETPEEPAARLGRTEAFLVSAGIHLLLLLVALFHTRLLPASLLRLLRARPAAVAALTPEVAPPTPAPLPEAVPEAPRKEDAMPLTFRYVRVPNDVPAPEPPRTGGPSDRDRIARQEIPTPPDARLLSSDPHSEGDTIDAVKPDAAVPEDETSLEGAPAAIASEAYEEATGAEGGNAGAAPEAGGEGSAGRGAGDRAGSVAGPGQSTRRLRPGEAGPGRSGTVGPAADLLRKARETLRDAGSGEFKHTFHNPAFLRDGALGALSFDTRGFPWGDYARRIYTIIGKNWRERLPLAFREGLRGYTCVHFFIEKGGTMTGLEVVIPSSVPPFTRAAEHGLLASSPLPPLPEAFPGDREGLTYCFYYNMIPAEAGEIRP